MAKKHGSNVIITRDRIEDYLIERIDRKAEAGHYNEEVVEPVRVDLDGSRTWQF